MGQKTHWADAVAMGTPGGEKDPARAHDMEGRIDEKRLQQAAREGKADRGGATLGDLLRAKAKVDPGIAGDLRELKRTLPRSK